MALIIERKEIDGTTYQYTYSSIGMMIEREGVLYYDAIDPLDIPRTYTETDIPVPVEFTDAEYAEAGKILMGVTE